MLKNALTRHFNYELNQASPVQVDYVQVENVDEDGNVFATREKIDYEKFQSSLGSVKDWSLTSLMKAGIDPNFPIHTGNTTRLAVAADMADWSAQADAILTAPEDLPAE